MSNDTAPVDALGVAEDFLGHLQAAFSSQSVDAIQALLLPNGFVRDLLVTDWNFASVSRNELKGFWAKGVPDVTNLTVSKTKSPPVYVDAVGWVQAYYGFETCIGRGEGMLRLLRDAEDSNKWKALSLSLTLQSLLAHPPPTGLLRPSGLPSEIPSPHTTWLEHRLSQSSFTSNPPSVLIVGAGHCGLMLAAHLHVLGVPTLIVDKNERVGDNWRKRYRTLVFHDYVWSDHFPYLKFPENYPVYSNKDLMADWMEGYAKIMGLNVWTESTVEPGSARYDDQTGLWTISIGRPDGSVRLLRPRHVVQATGHSGEPNVPTFAGSERFSGPIIHSTAYKGTEEWSGKKVAVVGSGNSGHDIAEDLYHRGVDVTMVQRGGMLVMSLDPGVAMLLKPLYSEGGPPTEESDLAVASFPQRAAAPYAQGLHNLINQLDSELLDRLRQAGFKLDEETKGGMYAKYFAKGGGFYVNTGCSDLIIERKVKVKADSDIELLEEEGLVFKNGSKLDADVVVLATGFVSMKETTRKIFGPEVVDRVGPVWGVDEQGELQGVWRRSGHPGLWFLGGNFALARVYSKYLALHLQAIEVGIAPRS